MSAVALQKAIYDKLTADLSYSVFDDVPSGTDYPYIVIGEDTLIDYNTNEKSGFEATLTVHSWSDYPGRKEVKEIQGAIYNALNRQELTVTGYNFVECYQEFSETFLENDGITRHGVQRFKVFYIEV